MDENNTDNLLKGESIFRILYYFKISILAQLNIPLYRYTSTYIHT